MSSAQLDLRPLPNRYKALTLDGVRLSRKSGPAQAGSRCRIGIVY